VVTGSELLTNKSRHKTYTYIKKNKKKKEPGTLHKLKSPKRSHELTLIRTQA
jgi:hypothetical protein